MRLKDKLFGKSKKVLSVVDADAKVTARRNISILHLSDLHITGFILAEKYYTLLDDITKQAQALKEIVLVVSGDIVNQGEVEDSRSAVLQFFTYLKESIGNKIIDVEIVPGNHDINRDYVLKKESYETALKGYFSLRSSILAIFGRTEDQNAAYGTSVVECAGHSVCFVRVDTSWFFEKKHFESYLNHLYAKDQVGDEESKVKKKLLKASMDARIDEYVRKQTREIVNEVNKHKYEAALKQRPIELIVAIAHHPLSWLMESSRESYVDFLRRHEVPDLDMWICGHAHDVKIHYDSDDNQSLIVLMSGVGGDELRRSIHRYSIYHLSLVRNVCAAIVRASQTNGAFKADDSIGFSDSSLRTNHFCYPLKTKSPGAVIPLNTIVGNPCMELCVDQDTISLMRALSRRMVSLGAKLVKTLDTMLFVGRILKKRYNLPDTKLFSVFLSRVCDDVVSVLMMGAQTSPLESLLSENLSISDVRLRAHFRVLIYDEGSKDVDVYRCLACSGINLPSVDVQSKIRMRDIGWDSLIKRAYEHEGQCLVRSVNDYDGANVTIWDDFLTGIVRCSNNKTVKRSCEMPLLTFGISARANDFECSSAACRLLYMLEFLDINNVVSLCVEEYLKRSSCNLSELFK